MSTVPAVLAAITALAITALPNSCQVVNGPAGAVAVTRGRVVLIGPDSDEEILITEDYDSLSNVTTSEEYFVPMTAVADYSGTDQTVADGAAFADCTAVLQAIADHPSGPTLGLEASGVISVQAVGERRFQRVANESGRHAVVRFGVQVYAQLS